MNWWSYDMVFPVLGSTSCVSLFFLILWFFKFIEWGRQKKNIEPFWTTTLLEFFLYRSIQFDPITINFNQTFFFFDHQLKWISVNEKKCSIIDRFTKEPRKLFRFIFVLPFLFVSLNLDLSSGKFCFFFVLVYLICNTTAGNIRNRFCFDQKKKKFTFFKCGNQKNLNIFAKIMAELLIITILCQYNLSMNKK